MGSYHHLLAVGVLVFALLFGADARAAEHPPSNITAKAGTARVEARKPTGPTPMVKRGLILPRGLLDPYMTPFARGVIEDFILDLR